MLNVSGPCISVYVKNFKIFRYRALFLQTPYNYMYEYVNTYSNQSNIFSSAEAVFGAQIVLPNEVLQNDELSVDTFVKKFTKILHVSAPSLPRHNSSTDLPSELPAELLSAHLVWVCRGSLVPPLQPLYDGPYAVLRHGPRSFIIQVESRDEVVAVSRLKACTAADAAPGSTHRLSRPPGSHPGGLAATKRVSFSDLLVSSPSPSSALPSNSPRTIFLPGKEVFARPGPAAPSQPSLELDLGPLLLPAEARARGEPCGELSTPLETVKPVQSTLVILYSACI